MNRDNIKQRCNTYIDEWKTNPEYALMLTGSWGCGKTFLIKEIIKERNEGAGTRLAWYISVFGVKKVTDLDDKLFEAAHPLLGGDNHKKWLSVSYGILKSATKYKFNINIDDAVEPINNMFTDKDEKPVGCQVLFVDDIERTDIDIKELFGYFSSIIEGGTRVIFIADETKIKDTIVYAEMKEKLIGETYNIEPEYERSIERFWNEEQFKDLTDANEYKQRVIQTAKQMGVKNLRIFRQTIHQWNLFFYQLPKKCQQDKEYLLEFFEVYFVLMVSCKLGVVKMHKVSNQKNYNGTMN